MTIRFHRHDLPDLSNYDVGAIAIDRTRSMELQPAKRTAGRPAPAA